MKPSLAQLTSELKITILESKIRQEETNYQNQLKAGAVFQELKEIRKVIREFRNELEWEKSGQSLSLEL